MFFMVFFCFKQKTAYEMRIRDWSSDVCSSDLQRLLETRGEVVHAHGKVLGIRMAGVAGNTPEMRMHAGVSRFREMGPCSLSPAAPAGSARSSSRRDP